MVNPIERVKGGAHALKHSEKNDCVAGSGDIYQYSKDEVDQINFLITSRGMSMNEAIEELRSPYNIPIPEGKVIKAKSRKERIREDARRNKATMPRNDIVLPGSPTTGRVS